MGPKSPRDDQGTRMTLVKPVLKAKNGKCAGRRSNFVRLMGTGVATTKLTNLSLAGPIHQVTGSPDVAPSGLIASDVSASPESPSEPLPFRSAIAAYIPPAVLLPSQCAEMLPDLEVPVYPVFALLSLGLVLLLIGIVLRFAFTRPPWILSKTEPWKAVDFVRGSLPSISTIASFPDLPQIVVDDPPDYEEARSSPCPSYEDVVVSVDGAVARSSLDLLAVIP
ncbi:hypothetical protein QR680_013040 [Steinernema hermaphroditum]|uniref:Uncharacterized protein n=1 Tax=Steinernema hermaphroditum TaxID=289476 RepID=A0AA39I463_9BILA|nr:hypothetical protein QR680_013040 [Steinernema hermaphroditum]